MSRILYLDYDGVLHDEHVYFHPKRGIYIGTAGRTLFEWMHILDEILRPHPDVRIVLSTSWVRQRGFNFAKKQLTPALQGRVVGATFHRREMREDLFHQMVRGEQIAQDVFRRGPTAWFAIDDDYIGWPGWCRDNLIRTHGALGISCPKAQDAIRVMLERF